MACYWRKAAARVLVGSSLSPGEQLLHMDGRPPRYCRATCDRAKGRHQVGMGNE